MLELQRQPVAEGVVAMTEAKICEKVLGQKSGYIKGLGFALNQSHFLNLDHHLLSVKLSWSIDLLRLNYLWRLNNNNLRLNKIELSNWRPWYKDKINIINNLKKYCLMIHFL
ncbi:hypothetical protein CK203_056848 [Vitis vinifera]|uniref:Uncharacterized protein n=1 Tax=Vitis vinifera TaxID=29760 RepID=A0A438GQB4_VITVI|nr:hypothetical protein CK203_056848 [Vitis vinifera]